MVRTPLISVIIPAYNCERFLYATLGSILAQTATNWECVVVDDGSKDGTFAVAQFYSERDPRIRSLTQANGGPSSARNHGYRESNPHSQYVTFMDSDDLWLPDTLQILKSELERCPEAVGAHGLAEFIDEYGCPVAPGEYAAAGRRRLGFDGKRLVEWSLDQPTNFRVLVSGNVLFPPGLVLARRQFYQLVGPFDESFKGPEDWDMLIRLSRHGDLQFINKVLLLYRRHGSNLGAANGVAEQAWRVRCKAFFSPENTREQQRVAKGGWRAYQVFMMQQRIATAKQHLASRQYVKAGSTMVRLPIHAYRYLRGYPAPRVVTQVERWSSQKKEHIC